MKLLFIILVALLIGCKSTEQRTEKPFEYNFERSKDKATSTMDSFQVYGTFARLVSSNSKPKQPLRRRSLSVESLENRELLSVTPLQLAPHVSETEPVVVVQPPVAIYQTPEFLSAADKDDDTSNRPFKTNADYWDLSKRYEKIEVGRTIIEALPS